jgi:hypothetical protein
MTKNIDLGEAHVHPSMPAPYVEFVRQLWHTEEDESKYTWSWQLVTDRRSIYLNLLASETLGTELQRVYETSIGAKIAEALTSQAVHIPELWMSEDKRTKKEQAAQFRTLRAAVSAMERVLARLAQDRTLPKEGVTQHRRATRFSSKLDAQAHRLIPLAFDDVLSEPVVLRRSKGRAIRVRLSIYDLNKMLRAFVKPINHKIENINKFRTHAASNPVLRYMGQITKGTPQVRYAVLLLDHSIDRFARDLKAFNLSRDKLISAFVRAVYPNIDERVAAYQAVNRICGQRRKSVTKAGA